tara:strand:+ start:933 stop:1118 length:186 start_codon:yes stop_codon:yes gene_type:complete
MSSGAKKWLEENEWPDLPVDSDAFSHYTTMSKLMDQFAKEYHHRALVKWSIVESASFNNHL